ncbi:S-DNA-T family DNA segregation ATPase FtsK/SpoIIIE [Pullulanibacillus pueri]|uniref:DNA translocase FtsK n=1 Tax=Pullulanibacillus pueri TaxID=1437324 RepID=A0A8J3EM48_9BACL|nr:DNA translocase FtsK [Pullulanibacillus pueri]MBM7682535.1 S-DNA-T family DNA segregation ATPase FtsK/SpoIIIE [Pullulanibacillus pueri]GGH82013.1 DNA translocase FtsK [Pullulanibacillus pueri]
MARKRKKKRQTKKGWKQMFIYETTGLLLFALTCIGITKMGVAGKVLVQVARFFAGEWYILIFLGTLALSIYYIWSRKQPAYFSRRLVGVYLLCLALLLLSHVKLFESLTENNQWKNASVLRNTWELYREQLLGHISVKYLGGGMVGAICFAFFYVLFDAKGAMFMALFLILISIILITGKSIRDLLHKLLAKFRQAIVSAKENTAVKWEENKERKREKKEAKEKEQEAEAEASLELIDHAETSQDVEPPIIHDFNEQANPANKDEGHVESQDVQATDNEEAEDEEVNEQSFLVPELENESYQLPSFDLLHSPVKNSQSNERKHIAANVRKLEQTFESFGVKAKVKKVHLGPAVTKYEVYPDVGVKVSRIVNLNDDLALALAAKEIRIEAPIPGKSAVGIEVPNQEVAMVSLREVLESDYASKESSKLAIGLGRDISGVPILADLSKMPHLLVAGATGSGKSVCINGIITSLLMRTKPHEVKLLMVDPKMVELNVYNGVPHLLTPVVTDPKKASQALKKVVDEMERRYELFSHSGTRNITGYNNYIQKNNELTEEQQPFMPYIVVIIDELADLMMIASKDVEDAITRLAQMARAAGIHLIIATQRPSVDVITGVIKANIPSRIAFSVSSQTDSRTILDSGGAEKLLGKGDMLFLPIGASKPTRIQGAFLSDDEVEAVVDFVISQQKAQYQENMIPTDEPETKAQDVEDELFDDAVKLVVDMQTASVSMLQRRFRIGYTRAARLIDAMEDHHIIGPYEGSKPREVLISKIEDEISS